jgi:hypothetical protein
MPISCVRWLIECAITAYNPTDASATPAKNNKHTAQQSHRQAALRQPILECTHVVNGQIFIQALYGFAKRLRQCARRNKRPRHNRHLGSRLLRIRQIKQRIVLLPLPSATFADANWYAVIPASDFPRDRKSRNSG